MIELVLSAFVAGLVGSPHCIGMCGGFASACARTTGGAVAWNAGRLSTYAVLGAIAGYAGHLMPGPPWIPLAFSLVLLVWFAGALGGVLPQLSVKVPGIARAGGVLIRRGDVLSRYVFGMLTGLLPCGFLYFGLSFAIASASALTGALTTVAFGLGTVPALAFLSGVVHRFATRGLWARRALAAFILVFGVASLGMRLAHVHSNMLVQPDILVQPDPLVHPHTIP